jgi:hypothetical protein
MSCGGGGALYILAGSWLLLSFLFRHGEAGSRCSPTSASASVLFLPCAQQWMQRRGRIYTQKAAAEATIRQCQARHLGRVLGCITVHMRQKKKVHGRGGFGFVSTVFLQA